jgi:RNA polymerase sigma factor (sigma-70 family)
MQAGHPEAWDEAFNCLWPVALAVARSKLETCLPNEAEDIAIETLEELVGKVPVVKSAEELRPLAASIAHHRAVSLLREHFSQKRGQGKTGSLDALADAPGGPDCEPESPDSPLEELYQLELKEVLTGLLADLKPEHRAAIQDLLLDGLSYEQTARKRGWATGTVGVYLQRGLEAARRQRERNPKLLKEMAAFLRCILWL